MGDDAKVAVLLPVALGLAALSLGAFAPVAVTALAGFAAAGAAGFLRPEAPVRSGGLVFAPTAVLSVAAALWAVPVGAPALVFGLVSGLMVALVGSHLGAGLALRRQEGPGR